MASPLIVPIFQFPAPDGVNTSGYKVNTYVAGTSSPQDTYTDSTLAVANANPVVMDANGQANIWLGNLSYKLVGTDAAGTVLWTEDNVTQPGVSNSASEWIAFASVPTFISGSAGFGSFSTGADFVTGVSYIFSGAPAYTNVGVRVKYFVGSTPGYGTIYSCSSPGSSSVTTWTMKVDAGSPTYDNTVTLYYYGITTYNINGSLGRSSRVIAQAGSNVTMVNATATKLGGTPSEILDYLEEFVTDTFTARWAGTYRVFGHVLMNEGAATTGIANVAQSVIIRKNGAANITLTMNWPVAASIASTQAVPFNGSLTLASGDTVDIAVTMNFTGTAPTASLASLNIERVL